jgi:hypothetical protein
MSVVQIVLQMPLLLQVGVHDLLRHVSSQTSACQLGTASAPADQRPVKADDRHRRQPHSLRNGIGRDVGTACDDNHRSSPPTCAVNRRGVGSRNGIVSGDQRAIQIDGDQLVDVGKGSFVHDRAGGVRGRGNGRRPSTCIGSACQPPLGARCVKPPWPSSRCVLQFRGPNARGSPAWKTNGRSLLARRNT